MEFIRHFSDIDPAVTLQLRFKHFLGVIIEYTGRERALIGRLIVEKSSPTPEQQADLLKWHGAVEMGWGRERPLAPELDFGRGDLHRPLGAVLRLGWRPATQRQPHQPGERTARTEGGLMD